MIDTGNEHVQERKTSLLYAVFFYVICATSNVLQNTAHTEIGKTTGWYEYIPHILLILAIPAVVALFRTNRYRYVKYVIFFLFMIPYTTVDIIKFWAQPELFSSGDFIEIYSVLISPIFFSRRFWAVVSISLLGRYALIGLVLRTEVVISPMLFIMFFAIIGYLFLLLLLYAQRKIRDSYEMQDRLSQMIAHKERLEQLGRLAADLAKHMRQPLQSLLEYANRNDEPTTEERMKMRKLISESLSTLETALSLARTKSPEPLPGQSVLKADTPISFFDEKFTIPAHVILLYVYSGYPYVVDSVSKLHTHPVYYLPGFVLLAITPVIALLYWRGQLGKLKYIILFSLVITNVLTTLWLHWNGLSGMFNVYLGYYFILFSPFFLNIRYFWTVMGCSVFSYTLIGLLYKSLQIIYDISFLAMISAVTYVFLSRILNYLQAIRHALANQNELRTKVYQKDKTAAIGQFVAGLAHEIRNPLASIHSYFELEQPPGQELAAELREESARMLRIVAALGSLTRSQSSVLSVRPLHPHLLTEQVYSLLQPYAEKRGVRLELSLLPGDDWIEGDADLLKQAVMNIVKNAIEASPANESIRISVCAGQDGWTIAVEDRGEGLDEQQLQRIGEPFFTTKKKGTGLGLAISRQIIESHGGRVEVRSASGTGTTFDVFLPYAAGQLYSTAQPSMLVHVTDEL